MSRAGTPGHLPAAPADPLHILPPESLLLLLAAAGMLFLLLAWLYGRTRSIWSCVLAHGGQNAIAFALSV